MQKHKLSPTVGLYAFAYSFATYYTLVIKAYSFEEVWLGHFGLGIASTGIIPSSSLHKLKENILNKYGNCKNNQHS